MLAPHRYKKAHNLKMGLHERRYRTGGLDKVGWVVMSRQVWKSMRRSEILDSRLSAALVQVESRYLVLGIAHQAVLVSGPHLGSWAWVFRLWYLKTSNPVSSVFRLGYFKTGNPGHQT